MLSPSDIRTLAAESGLDWTIEEARAFGDIIYPLIDLDFEAYREKSKLDIASVTPYFQSLSSQ